MKTKKLISDWKLYFFEQDSLSISSPADLADSGADCINATVPGNVELDLIKAGYLPEDLLTGMNIKLAEKYETYEWWYETSFDAPALQSKKLHLTFDGVDCLATYYLNGVKIGETQNMLVEHSFDVTELLNEKNNTLHVNIKSAVLHGWEFEIPPYNTISWSSWSSESINTRKCPHSYGWDIFPRAVSAGIFRGVYFTAVNENEITGAYFFTKEITPTHADIGFMIDTSLSRELIGAKKEILIEGKCGTSEFSERFPLFGKAKLAYITVDNPSLWWPRGYGKPNLYDVKISVISGGKSYASKKMTVGIRKADLRLSDGTDGKKCEFKIMINNTPIFVKGTNHVPHSPYHSCSKDIYSKFFRLVTDINCNLVRVWGGGIYECDEFYEHCDREGIMVWQDFIMSCASYPQTREFEEELEKELKKVIIRLRNHPSLIVWSGDNENDGMYAVHGIDPNTNQLTRKTVRQALTIYDPYSNYVESSPYISAKMYSEAKKQVTNSGHNTFDDLFQAVNEYVSEIHLWGPRDYFKSSYYLSNKAAFISEIGYHGMPNRCSLEKILGSEYLWPYENNESWILHSTDNRGDDARVRLLANQIAQLFGAVPDNLDDFIIASQFSQAEANKFFIENSRMKKWNCGGIVWWNLLDGWPQLSDAVVDSFFEKKLAYHYIRKSQQDFCIMMDEPENWHCTVVAANDTLTDISGSVRITNTDSGHTVFETDFTAPKNSNTILGKVPVMHSDRNLFIIKWETDKTKAGSNHYISGSPSFDLTTFKHWGTLIKELL